ncbi:hypothetical protein ACPA9J_34660 [Pseudomonas aeruginosa]
MAFYQPEIPDTLYSYYCDLLNQAYEGHLAKVRWASAILAFRALGKSNIDFARDAFLDIAARKSCCVIAIDIKGFFDNLDHTHLKNAWRAILDTSHLPDDHYAVFRSPAKYFVHLQGSSPRRWASPRTTPSKAASEFASPMNSELRFVMAA